MIACDLLYLYMYILPVLFLKHLSTELNLNNAHLVEEPYILLLS